MAPRGFHHLAIKVRDLARAEAFYCGVLGLALLRRWPQPDGQGDRSLWVDTGDGGFIALERVETSDVDAAADAAAGGHFLLALRIRADQRASFRQRLARAGVAIERESPHTLYFRDPESNRLGLSHYPDSADTAEA